MLETPNVPTKGSTLSPAELCRRNEWGVGDRIAMRGCAPVIITAISRTMIIVQYPNEGETPVIEMGGYDWRRVVPDPEPEPRDWAAEIACEIEEIGGNSCVVGGLRRLTKNRSAFNRAVQAIVDRETPNGGAIEWAQWAQATDRYVAIHRGRAAEAYAFCGRWRWNVFDRGELAGGGEASEAQAKAAAEAVLRGGQP